MSVARLAEGQDIREFTGGQCSGLGINQSAVGTGGASDGLRGVVDEDVERTLCGNGIRECNNLGGVAEVDADDAQTVNPVVAVFHRFESADRVVGESRRDGQMCAVTQQAQRDVHADLRAAAGQKCASAGEISAGITFAAAGGSAIGAQLVVEGVDCGVALLADVARSRLDERAGGSARGVRLDRNARGLVVDAIG